MKEVGLAMVVVAIAMVFVARPRNGHVVPWLSTDNRQWAYAMAMIILLAMGGAIAFNY